MSDYFVCDLRLQSGEETIKTVNLRAIPHVGDHISTVLEHDGKLHQFIIKEIWHWVTDISTDHKVVIYISHI